MQNGKNKRNTEIREDADAILDDTDEILPFRYSITSYGADYPVDGLVKRMRDEAIFVPSFQREYVWSAKQASGFVESLLLGLPVPGIFLSKEPSTNRSLVIDGQQRLRSLLFFYDGWFKSKEKTFALTHVVPRLEGKTYNTLDDEDRRRLDDSILHATVVKQDEPSEDQSSIFFIFARLNTGGVTLHPQQIRDSLYHGMFQELLRELNNDTIWRDVFGAPNKALRDQELILRFFALYYDEPNYSEPMKEFLNGFMAKNRSLKTRSANELRDLFASSIKVASASIGERVFRLTKVLNAALFDSVMIGIARRLEKGEIKNLASLKSAYDSLLKRPEYVAAAERATAAKESISRRIQMATAAFARVK